MMSGKPIHRIVLDSSLLVGYPMIKIIPVPNSSFGAFFHNLQYCLPFSQTTIGEMMSGKPIHRIVLDSSLLVGYPMIKIIPVPINL
ncbi:hypothetical protein KSF78_0009056 [Schistosoma japonicum]|nr:hypothetical protein KSF78_0009056 [Schistosoma japonicum]